MNQRMILLMMTAIGVSGLVSGCSAIGFVGGTIIDNTLMEEKPLEVPTAEQLRDSAVTIAKGETIIVTKSNGQRFKGIYTGTRVVTVRLDREKASALLESGFVDLVPENLDLPRHGGDEGVGRPLPVLGAGPRFADAAAPVFVPGFESRLVTLSADALLLLADDGPVTVPVHEIAGISALRGKSTTMRLVILGAITDFMLLQGALGLLIAAS